LTLKRHRSSDDDLNAVLSEVELVGRTNLEKERERWENGRQLFACVFRLEPI